MFISTASSQQVCQSLTPRWRIQLLRLWTIFEIYFFFSLLIITSYILLSVCLGNIHRYFVTLSEMIIWMPPKPSTFHSWRLQDPLKVAKTGRLTGLPAASLMSHKIEESFCFLSENHFLLYAAVLRLPEFVSRVS